MADSVLSLFAILLIPFAVIGLALINTGLSRSRSAAHSALGSLVATALAVIVFLMAGSAFSGSPEQAIRSFQLASKTVAWASQGQPFSRSFHADNIHGLLILIFQMLAVGVAVQIPIAGGAERWRLTALCLSTTCLAGLIFPLVSFWVWGGGFLSQGANAFGLPYGAQDAGGAGVIQVSGGLTALITAWRLGPRQGKFTAAGIPTAMPGHNAVIVLVGSLIALVGWIGLIAAGALLFYSANLGSVLVSIINTLIAASGGAVSALFTTRTRFGKPDVSLTANGWLAGLVAISAGAPFVKWPEALVIGLASGVLVVFAIEIVELQMQVDDPAGAISVHAVGGIWGLLAVGFFTGHFLVQLMTVGTLLGFVLPISYVINSAINRFVPHRVDGAGERQGMDLFELGAGAYPEFVTHREDSVRRNR